MIAYRLYNGLQPRNRRVRLDECKNAVQVGRDLNISDHIIDQEVGHALEKGAKWPSYVVTALTNRGSRVAS